MLTTTKTWRPQVLPQIYPALLVWQINWECSPIKECQRGIPVFSCHTFYIPLFVWHLKFRNDHHYEVSVLCWPLALRFKSVMEPYKEGNYGLPRILIWEIIHSSNTLGNLWGEIKNPFAKDSEFQCMKEALFSAFCHMPGFPKYAWLTCAARQIWVKLLAPFLCIIRCLGKARICFTLDPQYFIALFFPPILASHCFWQSQACGINRL